MNNMSGANASPIGRSHQLMNTSAADIVIIGGGIIGSSVALNLLQDGFSGRVLVIERDSSYQFASSALAMGGVRQQFMSSVNVRMVQYSLRVFEAFPECNFRQRGYLFLGNESNWPTLQRRYETQKSLGAECELLTVSAIRRLVPELRCDDLAGGVFGPKDGYVDPRAALRVFRQKAEAAGATYISDEVQNVERGVVHAMKAGRIETPRIVIAAGAYSGSFGIPITPVRQQLFRCELPRPWDYEFPVVIDPGGVHWRSAPNNLREIVIAKTNADEPPGIRFGGDLERFHSDFLPALVRRLPEFRDVKLIFGWGGLYEMTKDHNGIIDKHPDIEGLYIAAGFSGHGLMMSPATGKLMSELIRTGRFETIDASPLSFTRFGRNELFWDEAMI
jgi:FAD-dependent oxidoreductase domain-containing protein 1